jgi:hypothetical protein
VEKDPVLPQVIDELAALKPSAHSTRQLCPNVLPTHPDNVYEAVSVGAEQDTALQTGMVPLNSVLVPHVKVAAAWLVSYV